MVAFDQVFSRPEGLIYGAISGLITFFCIGALTNAWTAWSDWSLISKAAFGLQLNDGCKVAVAGHIRAEGEPMKAPFSGKECVICEYDVCKPVGDSSDRDDDDAAADFAGFLMSPCKIDTSWGEVRLLGFPLIDDVISDHCVDTSEIAAAREFLSSTEFEDRSGMKVVSILSVFSDVWSDDDGRVERHMRLTRTPLDDIIPPDTETTAEAFREAIDNEQEEDDAYKHALDEGARLVYGLPTLSEKRIEPGEEVVVFGIYSEVHRGLMPPQGSASVNRLKRGTAEKVASRLRSSMLSNIIGGLLVLAILHGVIAYAVINFAEPKEVPLPVDNDVRLPLSTKYEVV